MSSEKCIKIILRLKIDILIWLYTRIKLVVPNVNISILYVIQLHYAYRKAPLNSLKSTVLNKADKRSI